MKSSSATSGQHEERPWREYLKPSFQGDYLFIDRRYPLAELAMIEVPARLASRLVLLYRVASSRAYTPFMMSQIPLRMTSLSAICPA
ncbi:hypothetical protein F7R04_26445 [Agrobacterium radiobacter]|nr:hypothetical protein F7R04_26445 [Agrobacterium tumefaciens]